MTKECFKCHQTLPLEEFYKHPMMGDGRLGKCKECTRFDVRINYEKKREHYLAYDRSRCMAPHRVAARKAYSQTNSAKESHRIALLAQRVKAPEKYKARMMLGNAVRDRRVKRLPCEVCGNPKSQGHHEDYSKPFDVRWLCSKHHREAHKAA